METMNTPAPQLPSQAMEEAEQEMPADLMAGNQEEADIKTVEDQAAAEEMQAQPEPSAEKPDADQINQAAAVTQQVVDEHQDDTAGVEEVQTEPAPEPEQMIVLAKDTVVAEVVSLDKTAAAPEMVEADEPPASSELPFPQESVSGDEKTATEPPEPDVQGFVQEETMTAGQLQEREKEPSGPETTKTVRQDQTPVPEIAPADAVNADDDLKKNDG